MLDQAAIHVIASACRVWAERTNNGRFHKDLSGMCAIASAYLFERLKKEGFDTVRLSLNDEHCFVEFPGGLIVDITATQFGLEPIVIARRHRLNKHHRGLYWKSGWKFDSVDALRNHQMCRGWPEGQTV